MPSRSACAHEGARASIYRGEAHFAILRKHSQHVDELLALLAQPGAHDLALQMRFGGPQGFRKRNGLPAGNGRPPLLRSEAAVEFLSNCRRDDGEQQENS